MRIARAAEPARADSAAPTRFVYDTNTSRATLQWDVSQGQSSIDAAKHLFDRINRANLTIYRDDLFGDTRAFENHFTYHALGHGQGTARPPSAAPAFVGAGRAERSARHRAAFAA